MSDSLIEESAARLFADKVDKAVRDETERGVFPAALWQAAQDSGFHLVLAGEDAGGIGESWLGAYPILRGLGYWQVPLPLAETMVGSLLLSMAGATLPDGPIALVEQAQGTTLQRSGSGSATRLTGEAHRIAWARHAGHALVSLADGDLALIDLRAGGAVAIRPDVNAARLPSDTVVLDGAPCVALVRNPLPRLKEPVWALGALTRGIMMVGALEWLLEQSVQYANDRVQFGKPIGRNQAIQQQLAALAGDIAASRVAALVGAADAPAAGAADNPHALFSIAVAKTRIGEAATRGAAVAHQVHGAIGFTHEHSLHFATRRLWAWREEFGSDAFWAERLGRAAIAGGSQGFWPSMTDRRFGEGTLAG